MKRVATILTLAAALATAVASGAAADSSDDLQLDAPLDDSQLGATAVNRDNMEDVVKTETPEIDSGRLTGDALHQALARRCAAYSLLRQLDRALADCDRVLADDPRNGRALALRSHIRLQQAAFAPAATDLDKAIGGGGLAPDDLGYAYLLRAIARQALGDGEHAIMDLKQAVMLDPALRKLYQDIGRDLLHGQPADSLDEALTADPVTAYGYLDRGLEYLGRGYFDLATADFDRALQIEPRLPEAFAGRAQAHYYRGENDAALADLQLALGLNAQLAGAAAAQAYVQYNTGDFSAAATGFAQQARQSASDLYAPLWADVARRRAASPDDFDLRHELDRRLAVLDGSKWPRPLLLHFAGKLAAADVLKAAKSGDEAQRRRQICEAYFFLGTRALLDRKATARGLLQEAASTCAAATRERITAQTELTRLGN